jgi:hypothetical protein
MTKSITTPAPGEIGHNSMIPTARQVTDEMTMRFADLSEAAAAALEAAGGLPEKITGKTLLGEVSRSVIALRDLSKRAETSREAEKAPYLRAGQAVDAFFKEVIVRLDKMGSILNRRVNDYQQEQLAAERRAREAEQQETMRLAEEARLKAVRARTDANRSAREIEAALAERRASEAQEAAEATPAGMVRERFADGPLVTMKTVKYVQITDIKAIPLDELRPYLKPSAIEDAVRNWARATEYTGTMAGVEVGERDESVVR